MIDEEEILKEFYKAFEEALELYKGDYLPYQSITTFIEDKVWESTVKYNRMMNLTKEKFFESLYKNIPIEEYERSIRELWDIDHSYMDKAIEELRRMVMQKELYDADKYGNVSTRSIKLENSWRDYLPGDYEFYPLNPDRDFRLLEQRYVNRHIKLYKTIMERYKDSPNRERDLANFLKRYEELDKTIPYFSHTTGEIKCYQTLTTYLNMLYNVNLTRSSWNSSIYDAKILDTHLWYLPAHPYACPHCMEYQGYVYTDHTPTPREFNILTRYGLPGEENWEKEVAIKGGVGHPNCKHVWTIYWSETQIQEEKYNSAEWEDKYKKKQKLQSLDLEKSRLLSSRRVFKELGQQDLVDEATKKIKDIREKMKELE